ncbi:hypothetical protein ILYODFUR_032439, partial [Ilyodon furcidens]
MTITDVLCSFMIMCYLCIVFFLMRLCFCFTGGYWEIVMESLPQISVLDDLDRLRHLSSPGISSLCDIPCLEDYADFLVSSDASHSEAVKGAATTPCIDKVLTQFREQIALEKTTEQATDPVTQPVRQSSQPVCPTVTDPPNPINEERIKKLEHQVSQLIQQKATDGLHPGFIYFTVLWKGFRNSPVTSSITPCIAK